jgi:hypothetical protein
MALAVWIFSDLRSRKEDEQAWGSAVANDNQDPISGTPNVVRSHYERVVEAGAWGMVLVVETDLELGPNLDHQAKARLEALTNACQSRIKRDAMGVQRIRLVKVSR